MRAQLKLSRRFAALIDNSQSTRHPVIDVAGHGDTLVISLDDTARVLVQTDRALLVDPGTIAGERLAVMMQRAVSRRSGADTPFAIEGWVTDETTRFDLRVLETVLRFVCTSLDYELQVLTNRVQEILEELAASPTTGTLQQLVPIKHSLAAFETQVSELKDSIEVNVNQPKELAQIENLGLPDRSERAPASGAAGSTLVDPSVNLAYELLDEIFWTVDEIENETAQLMANIRASEEVLAITLDKNRNQLIKLNLVATTGAFVASLGSMAAGLFGMNVHVEEFTDIALSPWLQTSHFPVVCGAICSVTALSAMGLYRWHGALMRDRKHTVLAQAVIDKLHTRYHEVESVAITRYGQLSMIDRSKFMVVMSDLRVPLGPEQVEALFDMLGAGNDETISVNLLLSVVRQHAKANMVRERPTEFAEIDVMPPHVPLSRMVLPTSRSATGNKFFTVNS